jgi:hypothetical protein
MSKTQVGFIVNYIHRASKPDGKERQDANQHEAKHALPCTHTHHKKNKGGGDGDREQHVPIHSHTLILSPRILLTLVRTLELPSTIFSTFFHSFCQFTGEWSYERIRLRSWADASVGGSGDSAGLVRCIHDYTTRERERGFI